MRTGGTPTEWKVIPVAPAGVEVFKSPDPEMVFLGNPSIVTLPGGRIVVSLDLSGPGVKRLQGIKGRAPTSGHWMQGKVFGSNDKGKTWAFKTEFPFHQAQLFRIGGTLYLLGLADDFRIMRSLDGGDTWSKPEDLKLADSEFTLTPVHALCTKDHVYLAAMKKVAKEDAREPSISFVPVVLRARQGLDLTDRKSWVCSEPAKPLNEFVTRECLNYLGLAAPSLPATDPGKKGDKPGMRRPADRLEWDAPHILQVRDPGHYWHDPRGQTFQLLATARIHKTNVAATARVVEDDAGHMTIAPESGYGGATTTFIPVPGGNLKFDIVYDEESRMYWLASNVAADSMIRRERTALHDDRQRLVLHFSRNLVDWCFAGCIDFGASAKDLRHFCSLAVSGNDLFVVCCSGQTKPGTRGYTDRITFHSIPSFRELVY